MNQLPKIRKLLYTLILLTAALVAATAYAQSTTVPPNQQQSMSTFALIAFIMSLVMNTLTIIGFIIAMKKQRSEMDEKIAKKNETKTFETMKSDDGKRIIDGVARGVMAVHDADPTAHIVYQKQVKAEQQAFAAELLHDHNEAEDAHFRAFRTHNADPAAHHGVFDDYVERRELDQHVAQIQRQIQTFNGDVVKGQENILEAMKGLGMLVQKEHTDLEGRFANLERHLLQMNIRGGGSGSRS